MVLRALNLLRRHHCRPLYKEMYSKGWQNNNMSWGPWSPQVPKSSRSRKRDDKKDTKKEEGLVKSYDSGSSAAGSQSSDSSSTEVKFMQEFMAMIKENKMEVPERLQKFVQDDPKVALKEQQKALNKKRKLMNKIENKKKAIDADKLKWEKWVQDMKTEVQQQRSKFEENQKRLNSELEALIIEEKKLEAEDEAADMEEIQDSPGVDEILDACSADADSKNKESREHQARMMEAKLQESQEHQARMMEAKFQEMQMKMEAHYQQKLEEQRQQLIQAAMARPPGATEVVDLVGDNQKISIAQGLGIGTQLARNAVAPFGVFKERSSPYGRNAKMGDGLNPQDGKDIPPDGGGAG